ncbi:MAG: permease [Verrucomicrobiae bacterium]|nr:permease [Verrucomicrobiae bacterium]
MNFDWKTEWKTLVLIAAGFIAAYFLPVGTPRFDNAVRESFELVRWYAREHVILCLIPAFYIAGAIGVFVSKESVMKYLGAGTNKILAYSVASVSGAILAVCSCTVLPLFGGIWKMGAGLGPAIAFLYSGPAINALAIILTAKVLGLELGVARAVGAIAFSVIIGFLMHLLYRKEEEEKIAGAMQMGTADPERPLWQTAIYFATMIGILVFANWGKPDEMNGFWFVIWSYKWKITAMFSVLFALTLWRWIGLKPLHVVFSALLTGAVALMFPDKPSAAFLVGAICLGVITSKTEGEPSEWFYSTWTFAKQIMPLLLLGVLAAGFFLGRPGNEGVIPNAFIEKLVGGNSFVSNLFASVVGAFMYFATLTEVPILQGLIGSGMGNGPALALLLAGPALSLPSMLVLRSIMGTGKTVAYVVLVIIFSTITGLIYGALF